jgi:hypothetical protein
MRIYNGKNSQVNLPLAAQRISIEPMSVSKDIMPSSELLDLLSMSFDDSEIALIVSGPSELNLCAKTPACAPLVVQSLDEALIRFNKAEDKSEDKSEDTETEEVVKEEPVEETSESEPDKDIQTEKDEVEEPKNSEKVKIKVRAKK